MKLAIVNEQGQEIKIDTMVEGGGTQKELLDIFNEAFQLHIRKHRTYGDAFRSQGYMGNVARVLSKAARIKHMLWTDRGVVTSQDETVEDTLLDLINLAAFTLINRKGRNKWGQ